MNKPPETAGAANAEPLLRVERHAGHRADTEPQRLHLGACTVAVTAILDRSLDPRHRHFKVRVGDGGVYIFRHDTARDRWELTLFDSGRRDETRLSST